MPKLRDEIEILLPGLARYARALTGERAAAEDLVQDCVARALAAEGQHRGGSIKAWLFTIMTNLNRNRYRAMARRQFVPVDEAEAIEATTAEPELRVAIDRALACLSAEKREVLLLVGLQGMSYAEVAETLAVPVGTVMSRLSRARTEFRVALEDGRPETTTLRRVK